MQTLEEIDKEAEKLSEMRNKIMEENDLLLCLDCEKYYKAKQCKVSVIWESTAGEKRFLEKKVECPKGHARYFQD